MESNNIKFKNIVKIQKQKENKKKRSENNLILYNKGKGWKKRNTLR